MSKLTDQSLMPFGMHKNKIMENVPAAWLDWFHGECNPEKTNSEARAVLDYIKRNRKAITAELEEQS